MPARNMSYEEVEKYATGEVFLGLKAKEIGFIDEIGYYPNVLEDLREATNSPGAIIVTYEESLSILELFGIKTLFKTPDAQSQLTFR